LAVFSRYLKFERGLSPATADSYSYAIRTYLVHLEGRGLEPAAATANDVAAYLGMKSEHGLKAVSVFAIGMALRSFYGFLMLKGIVPSNPAQALSLPRFRTRIPDPLSEEEVEKLFS
jgi:site-specific recombinase XerD